MLKYLAAKIGADTDENEPSEICACGPSENFSVRGLSLVAQFLKNDPIFSKSNLKLKKKAHS